MITIYGCSTKRQFVPTTLVTLACRDGYERAAHLYSALQRASAHVLPRRRATFTTHPEER